jgi:hypothetical protein
MESGAKARGMSIEYSQNARGTHASRPAGRPAISAGKALRAWPHTFARERTFATVVRPRASA